MLKVYFGEFSNGRLRRLQYFGYALLLFALALGSVFGIVFAIGAGEYLMGGDLQEAQTELANRFSVPAVLTLGLIYFLVLVAKLNIMAKRIRDMGLSGWWIALAVFVVVGLTSNTASPEAGSTLFSLVTLLLLFIPSDTFG